MDQQEEAVRWLFGLEGPALIVALIVLAALAYAYWQKDKSYTKVQQDRIEDGKQAAQRDRDALEHTLTVVTGLQHTLDTLADKLTGQGDEVVKEVHQCSQKIGEAGEGVKELLTRVPPRS